MKFVIESTLRNCKGEKVCGDAFEYVSNGDHITMAVVDGLGHGTGAAKASAAFIESFIDNSSKSLSAIINKATDDIARTRGVVAALLRFDAVKKNLIFCGVGNIELTAVSDKPIRPISTVGIIGRKIRKILEFQYALQPGDLIIVHSDGISGKFDIHNYKHLELPELTQTVVNDWGKDNDDATCVAIRVL